MNANNILKAFEPRQVKAIAVGVLAIIGLTLAAVAFGVTSDHMSLAKQVVDAVSHGPVGDAVHSIYIK